MKRITKSLLAALTCISLGASAQSPTAPALGFNVFLEKGAKLVTNETEGPVAIGTDLTLEGSSYQVSTNSAGSFLTNLVKTSLVVGGKVNFVSGNGLQVNQNGYVKIGDTTNTYVWYKDQNNAYSPIRITPGNNYNGTPKISMSANSLQLGVSAVLNPIFAKNVIDFTTAFATMKAKSTSIGMCADNAVITNPNGGVIAHTNLPSQVKINLALGLNVLNLTGTDMNNCQQFTFNNAPDALHWLVINVNASGTFNWNVWNQGGIGFSNCPYIMYNFYNTTTLNIQGNGAVEGTLFAPFADIVKTANQANIEGQVIAQSYLHAGGENHYAVFAPTVAGCAVAPVANFTINTLTQCLTGNSFTCTNATTTGTGPFTYLWDFGDNTTSTLASPVKNYTAAGTYTIKLTVTGPGGTSVYTRVVIVNAMPLKGFSVNTLIQSLTGNSFLFTPTVSLLSSTCLWRFGDGTVSSALIPVKSYTAAGTYKVWQIVTNLAGCIDSIATNVVISSDSVGSGNQGGLESESLGGLVAKRDFNRIKNSVDMRVDYNNTPVFSASRSHVSRLGKSGNGDLADLFPKQLEAGNVLRVTTPTDLLTLTAAVEVLSVDYTVNNQAKAVVLGLKTLNKAYSHTKSICDRLRGATLLGVENITIKGLHFTQFTLKQEDGMIEYGISFVAGKKAGRNTLSFQTNWLVSEYMPDDTLYTFQVWAAQPSNTAKLVSDIIDNLNAVQPISQTDAAMLPKAYVTRGFRSKENLVLYIHNETNVTNAKLVFEERLNEQSTFSTFEMPVTLTAGDDNVVNVPVKDGYEYDGAFYLDTVLNDNIYMADGNWGLDYDHMKTSVSTFAVSNDPARTYSAKEFSIYRNVDLKVLSSDYITLYKAVKPGTTKADLTAFDQVSFFAKGKGKVTIRLTKDGIIDWASQYKTTVNLTEAGSTYTIRFSDFKSDNSTAAFVPNDVKILAFTFTADGSNSQEFDLNVQNISFTSSGTPTGINEAKAAAQIAVYPNPNTGSFAFSFRSDNEQSLDVNVTDLLGKVVYSKKVNAVKGDNTASIDLGTAVNGPAILFISLKGNGQSYTAKKFIVE